MPRRANELGPMDIKRAQHPGNKTRAISIQVGGVSGLLLQIAPTGAKSWLLRTVAGIKRREIGLGPYPEVSLAEARERARAAKAQIAAGNDPVEQKRAARAALIAAQRRGLTFAQAVDDWMKAKAEEMGTEKRRKYIANVFTTYAHPEIGKMLVQEIGSQDVLRVLSPIWATKHETASKLRQRIEAVLSWATVAGHRTGDNPARWGGNLRELLPRPDAVSEAGNQPALAIADVPRWWADLGKRSGMGAAALRFLMLTCTRSGEVRGAVWSEIDLDGATWTIPAGRMKAGREHRVALSPAAVALLKGLPRLAGSPFVFPAIKGGQLSDMTISKVMRMMQEAEVAKGRAGWLDLRSGRPAVPHGLRSTFRDWAAERGVDRDLAELTLAHQVGTAVERAYRRSDMIERRRALAQQWSDFLDGRGQGKVITFPTANAG